MKNGGVREEIIGCTVLNDEEKSICYGLNSTDELLDVPPDVIHLEITQSKFTEFIGADLIKFTRLRNLTLSNS